MLRITGTRVQPPYLKAPPPGRCSIRTRLERVEPNPRHNCLRLVRSEVSRCPPTASNHVSVSGIWRRHALQIIHLHCIRGGYPKVEFRFFPALNWFAFSILFAFQISFDHRKILTWSQNRKVVAFTYILYIIYKIEKCSTHSRERRVTPQKEVDVSKSR